MKTFLKTPLLCFLVCTMTLLSAQAQDKEWLKKSPQERAAKETEALRQELNLTEKQLDKVEKITAKKYADAAELMRDVDKDIEDRREKLLRIWEDWDEDIQDVLKDGQEEAYAKVKMDYKEKFFK